MHRVLAGHAVTKFETAYAHLDRVNVDTPIAGRVVERCESAGKHLLIVFSGDLMDRSKITAAFPDVEFAREAAESAGADVVVVDLARHAPMVGAVRRLAPVVRIVSFGPHVDDEAATQAKVAGADAVLPRSRFFRDVAAALCA